MTTLSLGKYQINVMSTLGKGTFGIVHKGYHKETNKKVAAKRIKIDSDELGGEAMKEIKNFQHLGKHPHIVQLLDFHYMQNSIWMVMDYCDSGDLLQHFKSNDPDISFILKVMHQSVSAIHYMHSLPTPVVHRDIKPANIMMTMEEGVLVIKVTDFGLSKVVEEQDPAVTVMFSTVAGTPAFMAPEFFAQQKYEKSVDTFALGLVFLAMIQHHNSKIKELIPLTENGQRGAMLMPVGAEMYNNSKLGKPQPALTVIKGSDTDPIKECKELIKGMCRFTGKDRTPLGEVEQKLARLTGSTLAAPTPGKMKEVGAEVVNELRPTRRRTSSPGGASRMSEISDATTIDDEDVNVAVRLLAEALDAQLGEQLGKLKEAALIEQERRRAKNMPFAERLAHVLGEGKGLERLDVGDRVKMDDNRSRAEKLQQNYGGWIDHMEKYLGRTGTVKERVLHVLKVDFGDGHSWSINPDLLTKVEDTSRSQADIQADVVEGLFKRGDIVKIPEEEEIIKLLNENYGGWNSKMRSCLGIKGIVNRVNRGGSVRVECINGDKWSLNPELLVKVDHSHEVLEPGDFVYVIEDQDKVKSLQKGHGEWVTAMKEALGSAGVVREVGGSSRARVEVGGGKWILNQKCLKLVAKGEEMLTAILRKKQFQQ